MGEATTFQHFSKLPTQYVVGQMIDAQWRPSYYWLCKSSILWVKMHESTESQRRGDQDRMNRLAAMAAKPELAAEAQELLSAAREFQQFSDDYRFRLELLKEYIFEAVRQAQFPERPSRRECMFCLDQGPTAEATVAAMGLVDISTTRLRIRPTRYAGWFRADASLLNCNDRTPAEIEDYARRYWTGLQAPQVGAEVLLVGMVEVVEVEVLK